MTRRRTARDHPINLRDWQAKACVEGRLSVLVVPIKPQPEGADIVVDLGGGTFAHAAPNGSHMSGEWRLPLIVGDRYWGREQHAIVPRTAYRMSVGVQQTDSPVDPDMAAIYRAGWERSKPGWRSSTAMPREFSRITIVPTSVRVCRLHEVTEDEARAAGLRCAAHPSGGLVAWHAAPDDPGQMEPAEALAYTLGVRQSTWCATARCAVHLRNIDKESDR